MPPPSFVVSSVATRFSQAAVIADCGISVAHGKIETVSWRDVSFKIGVEDVGRSLLLMWWVTGSGALARLNADNDDNQNGR